jgi:hypothetical protein
LVFAIVLVTALMGYLSSQLQPLTNSQKFYPKAIRLFNVFSYDFKKRYGEDGNAIIAIESDKMYRPGLL